jgi:hypothetical protein
VYVKIKVKVFELLTNSKNSHSNPLQKAHGCNCDPENTYRKPPLILKMVPEAGYDVYTGKINQYQNN